MNDLAGSTAEALATGPEPDVVPAVDPKTRIRRNKVEGERDIRRHLEVLPAEDLEDLDAARPKTRADCIDGPRPCPFVGCKHHLFLEVNRSGGITFNHPNKELEELKDTCALDVAARGAITLEEVSNHVSLTRERIRQIESRSLLKLKSRAQALSARDELLGGNDKFTPGKSIPKYVPSPRVVVAPEAPPPPSPVIFIPPVEPIPMPKPRPRDTDQEDFEEEELEEELEDTEEGDESEDEETSDDESEESEEETDEEGQEEPEEEPKPMKKRNKLTAPLHVTELTDREKLILEHYMAIATDTGAKPSPLKIAKACGFKGDNRAVSANICTTLKKISRKGVPLPFFFEKAARGPDKNEETAGRARANRRKAKREAPELAMPNQGHPSLRTNLLREKERLQKKIIAIDILLSG